MAGRVTQVAVEALGTPSGVSARLSQAVLEVLGDATSATARVSQAVIEVLIENPIPYDPYAHVPTTRQVNPFVTATSSDNLSGVGVGSGSAFGPQGAGFGCADDEGGFVSPPIDPIDTTLFDIWSVERTRRMIAESLGTPLDSIQLDLAGVSSAAVTNAWLVIDQEYIEVDSNFAGAPWLRFGFDGPLGFLDAAYNNSGSVPHDRNEYTKEISSASSRNWANLLAVSELQGSSPSGAGGIHGDWYIYKLYVRRLHSDGSYSYLYPSGLSFSIGSGTGNVNESRSEYPWGVSWLRRVGTGGLSDSPYTYWWNWIIYGGSIYARYVPLPADSMSLADAVATAVGP